MTQIIIRVLIAVVLFIIPAPNPAGAEKNGARDWEAEKTIVAEFETIAPGL